MSLYTQLVSSMLFPLHERLKKHTTVSVRKGLEDSQWWSRGRILELQLARLRELLTHAQQHVPYYRDLFAELGFEPESIAGLQDLEKLPFLTKPIIREHVDQLKADDAVGLTRFNTGGSSGEPLIFYIGRKRVSHDVAAKWRATRWWDVDIGDPEIVVWGSPIELGAQDRIRQLRDLVIRTRLIAAFEMSDENLDKFVREICRYRPKMLFGYPSSLAHIARYAEKNGVAVNNLGIKVAFVTSERLYEDQKADIERIFNCPVANGYGGRDAGFIAHQCPSGGMHITAEDIIVEVVDKEGRSLPPGQEGEVVITHLATSDFPFIRYRTGDIAILDDSTCACGRGLPLLKEIRGRTTDFLVAQDGTLMHGLALIYILRDLPGVGQFKIIQESLERTVIQVVSDTGLDAATIDAIKVGVKRRLGQGVDVGVQLCEQIPAEKSGKFRYVVSQVTAAGPA